MTKKLKVKYESSARYWYQYESYVWYPYRYWYRYGGIGETVGGSNGGGI